MLTGECGLGESMTLRAEPFVAVAFHPINKTRSEGKIEKNFYVLFQLIYMNIRGKQNFASII
jgi:hypothetical protein